MQKYLTLSLFFLFSLCCSTMASADEKPVDTQARKVIVQVNIDEKLIPNNSEEWVLYVYASKPGARMPLANYKGKLSELPAEIVLHQSMYLVPHLTLQQAENVVVVAKATQSKNPHQKSNEDIIGYSIPVSFSSGPQQSVTMAIDQHDKTLVKKVN